MQKSKLSKKLVSIATAGVMTLGAFAGTASTLATSMTASAATVNELLGEGTFQEGSALPWHICESLSGDMEFVVQDGVYVIEVVNPGGVSNGGEDRWDCQFRHRGLTILNGHTYRLTYSVWCSQDMTMYSKLGDMTNDDMENWHMNGTPLSLTTYDETDDMESLGEKLASATTTGSSIEYWQGWDAWKSETITANEWHTYSYEFTVNKDQMDNHQIDSNGTGEWTFHFGGDGQYTDTPCTKAGTIIKFDNLALIDMNDSTYNWVEEEDYEVSGIELNQVGFYPNCDKKATLVVDEGDSASKEFTVKDSSGNTVYTGTTSNYNSTKDAGSWQYCQTIDFSDFTTEGEGYYIECDGKTSLSFDIGDDIYDGMLKNALNYFYQNRSGEAISATYITSTGQNASKDDLARAAGHGEETVYVCTGWEQVIESDYTVMTDGKAKGYTFKDDSCVTHSKTTTVSAAWYDAGDHGKYAVNGGISVWTLNNLYERSVAQGDASKWADASGTMLIPENGNGNPDILDETKVETTFLMSAMVDDGDDEGMVYHKIHDFKWTALCVAPADDPLERVAKPPTYAATLNMAAACAQSSRLWEEYDSSYASELLAAAEKGYAAAKAKYVAKYGSLYASGVSGKNTDDEYFAPIEDGKGGGAYGDTDVDDEFYWAACELYLTTGDSTYYTDLSGYENAFTVATALYGGENEGTASAFTWGTLYSAGSLSLLLNTTDVVSDSDMTKLQDSVVEAADYYISLEEDSAYGIDYKGLTYDFDIWQFDSSTNTGETVTMEVEDGYEWGSNSMVVNNTIPMMYAYDITGDAKYVNGVISAFDYILGRNPLEQSYVTGYGEHCTEYPHHRWWSHENDSSFPYCPDGVLAGGPNSQMQDPMISGAGYKQGTIAPMTCYYDQLEAWSVNECTINWNSPLCYIVSFLEDEAPNVDSDDTDTDTTEATTDADDTTEATTKATTSAEDTTEGATATTAASNLEVTLWGDANNDGQVSIGDVVTMNKYLVGSLELDPQGAVNANCVADDTLDATDATTILGLNVQKYVQTDMPLSK